MQKPAVSSTCLTDHSFFFFSGFSGGWDFYHLRTGTTILSHSTPLQMIEEHSKFPAQNGSQHSQQHNSLWKLTLVEKIIPLKPSHSINFNFLIIIIRSSVLHVCRKGQKKLNVYWYKNMHYLPQRNDTSQKKIPTIIKPFFILLVRFVCLGFFWCFTGHVPKFNC